LGLSPPPPFLGDDGEGELGSSEGEEEDGVVGSTGKTGKTGQEGRVRGKRREMNRVAAKRHREKNKDRLKSVSPGRMRVRRQFRRLIGYCPSPLAGKTENVARHRFGGI
jgi:hypothetical protein